MTSNEALATPVWRLDVADTVADLAWSPTDDRLAVDCSGRDALVIGADGEVLERRFRHAAGTSSVAWHEGDVASAGVDGWVDLGGHRERLCGWVSALRLPATVGEVRWVTGADADAVGLVACGQGFVAEFDARRDANLACGGTVARVDTGGGGLLLVCCDDQAPLGVVDLGAPVAAIAWSPGNGQLGVAGSDGTVAALPRLTDWDWHDSAARWEVTDAL